jgi:hypothetical protein
LSSMWISDLIQDPNEAMYVILFVVIILMNAWVWLLWEKDDRIVYAPHPRKLAWFGLVWVWIVPVWFQTKRNVFLKFYAGRERETLRERESTKNNRIRNQKDGPRGETLSCRCISNVYFSLLKKMCFLPTCFSIVCLFRETKSNPIRS